MYYTTMINTLENDCLWGLCVGLSFACITYVLSGLSVILMWKRELVALLLLSFGYLGTVNVL